MNDKSTAITKDEVEQRQNKIKEYADNLAVAIIQYLFEIKLTGNATPTPPRPRREVVASTDYAARLCDAFKASGSTDNPY
jgi:hypothetical protein